MKVSVTQLYGALQRLLDDHAPRGDRYVMIPLLWRDAPFDTSHEVRSVMLERTPDCTDWLIELVTAKAVKQGPVRKEPTPRRCDGCDHCVVEAIVVSIGETQHPDERTCTLNPVWQSVAPDHYCGQYKPRAGV